MGKMIVYLTIISGIMILMYLSGAPVTSTNIMGQILNITSTGDVQSTPLYSTLLDSANSASGIAILAGIAVTITAGLFFGAGAVTVIASAVLGGILGLFASDILSLVTLAGAECDPNVAFCGSWVYWIIFAICLPVLIGYIIAIFEWILGDH